MATSMEAQALAQRRLQHSQVTLPPSPLRLLRSSSDKCCLAGVLQPPSPSGAPKQTQQQTRRAADSLSYGHRVGGAAKVTNTREGPGGRAPGAA